MADGTPDFTDLLAALDAQTPVNVHQNHHHHLSPGNSQMRGGLPRNQIQFLEQQQQQIPQYGQRISHFPQTNSIVLSSQDNHQHNIIQKDDAGALQHSNASPRLDNVVSVEEEQQFGGGGSLGSMFLSSVESLLSDESNNTFSIGIPAQQSRLTARRPRQRQKQPNQGRTVNRNLQNINTIPNANIALPANTVPVTCYVQTVSMHSPINSNQNANIKSTELTSSPFIVTTGMQQVHAVDGVSFVGSGSGHQKASVQTQFAHPAQGVRQQHIQPIVAPNPPRPLSASSSTSDHNSRPSSVHQPSPSCGSNHSGDPATPQSYNATTPQSYNPSTPQSRSVTPLTTQPQHQQHPVVLSDLAQQGAGNISLMMNNGTILSTQKNDAVHQSNSHHSTEDSLADLPTPVKEAMLSQNMKFNVADNVFQNASHHMVQHSHPSVTWTSGGLFQNTGLPPGQIQLTRPNLGKTSIVDTSYLSQNVSRMTNHHPNEFSGQIVSSFNMASQPLIGHERDSCYSTSSLTLTQSRLLEQMSSFGKAKTKPSENPLKSVQAANNTGALSSTMITDNSNVGLQSMPQNNTTMELIDRASNTGAATVRELLNSPQYEAISPVSDYALSPINKTSLGEEQSSDKNMFSSSQYQKCIVASEQENLNTSTPSFLSGDVITDPVLMYLKHDSVTHATASTVYSSSQSVFPPYNVGINTQATLPTSSVTHMAKEWKHLPTVQDRNSNSNVSSPILPEAFPTTKTVENRFQLAASSNSNPLHFKSGTEQPDQVPAVQRTQKNGQFGVNCRPSVNDQLKDSPNTNNKADSFDLDFGFGSDEPTIRLGKSQSIGTGLISSFTPAKADTSKRSTNTFSTHQKIGNDMKDAMEQLAKLNQQKQMLLQMQKCQVQKVTAHTPASMPQASYQTPGMFQTRIPKSSNTTGLFEPGLTHPDGTTENFLTTKPENWDELRSQAQTSSYYGTNSKKELDVSHNDNLRPLKSDTVQQLPTVFPESTDIPSKSLYLSTSSTTTQPSLLQQIDLSVKVPASTYPSPMFVSVPESVSLTSRSVSSFSKFLLPTSSVSASSVPTYLPQYGMPPIQVASDPVKSHLDFDWLHVASRPNEIHHPTVPSTRSINTTSAPSAPTTTSVSMVYSYAASHDVKSTFATTVASKPSLTVSLAIDTKSKSTDLTISNTKVTPSTTQLFSTIPSTATKEVAPSVHQETKYHHYGKKHRILEGSHLSFSESYHKYEPNTGPANQQASVPSFASGQSVLDKQRKYSREQSLKSLLDSSKTTVSQKQLPKVIESKETTNLPVTSSNVSEPHSVLAVTTVASLTVTSTSKINPLQENVEKEKPAKKNQRSGSMLSLFSSLLQEASDNLKTNLATEVEVTKTSDVKTISEKIQDKPSLPKKTSAVSMETVVNTATPAVTVNKTISDIKTVKKTRPAATIPFKRRPFPAIEDLVVETLVTSVTQISSNNLTVTTVSIATVTSSVASSTQNNIITTAVSSSIQSPVPVSSISTVTNNAKTSASVSQPTESSPSKITLPKIRITTFRSSGGQVILQSSMVGDHNVSELEKDSRRKRSKKKKKKHKRRRLSSSDYDSSVSSLTSVSSYEPTNKPVLGASKLTTVESKIEMKMDIAATATPAEFVTKEITKAPSEKRKRSGSVSKDAEKRKPTAKRAKVAKDSIKKKNQVPKEMKKKEPIVRYQPKSAYHAVSSSSVKSSKTSLPAPCHRAPGKLPLYLNTSETKSGTVPTIQLVARNTKLLEPCLENKITSPSQSKVVSVKIGSGISTKGIQNQILSSSGLQYLMPARSQQRIILPNISSSVTLPVSIVSPINNRASGTFFPRPVTMAATSVSTSSTKSHILLIPQPSVHSPQSIEIKTSAPSIVLSASSGSTSTSTVHSNSLTIVSAVQNVSKAPVSTILPAVNTESNMFQSTFLKLISSQNPIAKYSPPSSPAHLAFDDNSKTEHQCLECRDKFLHQSSLEDHYDRRCIMIKVRCMQCNQNLVFLNKCNLLRHAREHSDKGNGMQFNNAHISPLTTVMCKPRSKEFFLRNKATGATRNRVSTCSTTDDESSSDNLQSSACMMACTDCSFLACSSEVLEEHFQQQSSPPSPEVLGQAANFTAKPAGSLTCDMCHLTLYNQCSFMAHMRMHKRISPHTCPECGQTFDGKDMEFNLHLSIQCFHLSRMSCYKCRLCSSIFQTGDLLRRHLEVRHLQTFYKCRECPMAFKTQANIASHQRSAHGIAAVTKTIHKCPLCDTVFTDNSHTQQIFLLQKHFEGHINHPSINITAYKCLVCNNIYERKSLLREHLKTVHDVTSPGDSGSSSDLTKEINKAEILLDIGRRKEKMFNGNGKKPSKVVKRHLPIDKPQAVKDAKTFKSTDENSVECSNSLIASGTLDSQKKVVSQSGTIFSNKISSSGSPSNLKHTRQPLKLRLKGMNPHSTNGIDSKNMSKQHNDDCAASPLQLDDEDSIKHDRKSNSLFITTHDGKKLYPCVECGKEFYSSHSRCNHIRAKHRGIRTLYCCPYCPVDKIKFAKRISLVNHLKKTHSIMQITKKDIKLVSAHVSVPAGHRFKASTVTLSKDGSEMVVQNITNENAGTEISKGPKVRKKHTTLARKHKSMTALELAERRISLESSSDDEQLNDGLGRENKTTRDNKSEEYDFSTLHLPDTYICAKCNYQSDDRLEFQAHIQEHSEETEPGLNSSMQQCRECGLCFASSASLAKHLFIKHKIKRKEVLEKYDEQLVAKRTAAGNLPKSLMSQDGILSASADGSGPVVKKKQFKCEVCYHRFEEDSQLRTHMRTHGLAFVKSKHNVN